jgi:hypothetical protein
VTDPVKAGRKGQEVIARRAELRRDLHEGTTSLAELLHEPEVPEFLRTITVLKLVVMAPGMGEKTAGTLLAAIPLGLNRQLGETTYRQRRLLRDALLKHRPASKSARPRPLTPLPFARFNGGSIRRRPRKAGAA